jgi:hypothetical protein
MREGEGSGESRGVAGNRHTCVDVNCRPADERLLQQAPSWQLHRLKKTRLFRLHVMLGTWPANEAVDLDLYNKQELVDGLIKARSTSIASRNTSALEMSPTHATDGALSPPSSSKRGMKRSTTCSTLRSHSSAYTDEEDSASETEANDAGGEETEAEPMKSSNKNEDVRMRRLYEGPKSVASPMVNRLRHARNHALAAEPSKNAMSSAGVVSSPLGRRLPTSRSTLFAASSPVKTRLRTRNQSSSSSMRLSLPAHNRSSVAQSVFPRRVEQPTPKQQRRSRMQQHKLVTFTLGQSQQIP